MKNQLTLLLFVLISLSTYAQDNHNALESNGKEQKTPEFANEKIGIAYTHYIHLKDALVSSNASEAKKAASELKKALASIPNSQKATEAANTIASVSEIKKQRNTFSTLSNEMTTLVKASKLTSGSLYIEYCPMANNNEGGFWLSNEKEIKNPYFGDMMLRWGSVKETLGL